MSSDVEYRTQYRAQLIFEVRCHKPPISRDLPTSRESDGRALATIAAPIYEELRIMLHLDDDAALGLPHYRQEQGRLLGSEF